MASAVLLIGVKKQLVLFPNRLEVVQQLCAGPREEERGGASSLRSRGRDLSQRGVASSQGAREGVRRRGEVGKVLGNTLGYESDDEEEDEVDILTSRKRVEPESDKPHPSGSDPTHQPCPQSLEEECQRELVRQVCVGFRHWCERLADGTLKRYSVEAWPEWTHP